MLLFLNYYIYYDENFYNTCQVLYVTWFHQIWSQIDSSILMDNYEFGIT
jgi:hypothetical protein